ncbi:hypothetical protein K503DRAFT_749435 [Rhizopogon vinicolor AM-OR11-026]|uniref:DRBM domain-containing protein n=1 Tax=Rhizopogon vinicolor AM-OR11-026 TaxID=1314800 RepID=A0A1B7MJU9_9AGAM|nr:hypothetical protein K503DRAFT_749435 [Rhizopogon vinicolor AM-OR11-026]
MPHGNSDRLSQLGKSVLDTIVTFILFEERPMLTGEDFSTKHANILSDETVRSWLNSYDTELKRRVRRASPNILDDPEEARFLFNSYVGAVCVQGGLQATANWIGKLVKPDSDQPPGLMGNLGSRPTFAPATHAQAGTPHAAATAPPPYYPSAPQVPTPPPVVPLGTLALFNQTCNQRGFSLEWNSTSNGPSHDPRWEVRCMVNGVERGSGLGRNQKQAKELAAHQAWQYMQSTNWTLEQPEPTA